MISGSVRAGSVNAAAIVEGACIDAPVPRSLIARDGLIHDPGTRELISRTLLALMGAAGATAVA